MGEDLLIEALPTPFSSQLSNPDKKGLANYL